MQTSGHVYPGTQPAYNSLEARIKRMLLSCCNVEVARITPYYKVAEGVSGQSFDSGHALHASRIRSVSSSSELW